MKIKRNVLAIVVTLIFLISIPVSIVCVGFCLPAQYGKTYYAVLPKMFNKLKETSGKKIVVVGNSAVAFGLDPKLAESELDGYTVCPFGLYGAIGTKAMMDLSRVNIGEGDVVILAPEQISQSMSTYFNGEYLWNAADGNFGMLKYLKNAEQMTGSFVGYVGRKYGYYSKNSAPSPTDVYASSSFDDDLKMTFERPYNKLPLGYDPIGTISYKTQIFSREFADYINEYNDFVTSRGAKLLFGFAPVNAQGIETGTQVGDIDAFYDYADALLDCEILGSPHGYIFESDWFYDSNVHMNTAGSAVDTDRLVRDLKAILGDSSPVDNQLPEKPIAPDDDETGDDGKDAALFNYESEGTGWKIVSLTEEGARVSSIEIPDFYKGKRVLSFAPSVFGGNTAIEEIRVGKYVYAIEDKSFSGCTNLKRLYMPKGNLPSKCAAYFALLEGAPECMIYVPENLLSEYANDYFWSRYAAYLKGYL